MTKYVAILGKPGAGKSTITKDLGFPVFSAGDLARKYLPTKASQGLFVNQRRIAQLMSNEIKKHGNEVVILEGTPLSLVTLDEYRKNGIDFSLAIYLQASDALVKARLEQRGRDTDKKYMNRRLLSFKRKTLPLIKEFKKNQMLVLIRAGNSPDSIIPSIKKAIGKLIANN